MQSKYIPCKLQSRNILRSPIHPKYWNLNSNGTLSVLKIGNDRILKKYNVIEWPYIGQTVMKHHELSPLDILENDCIDIDNTLSFSCGGPCPPSPPLILILIWSQVLCCHIPILFSIEMQVSMWGSLLADSDDADSVLYSLIRERSGGDCAEDS